MGSATYIGRVGALAVALGVGIAVAGAPGVAAADSATDSASTSDSSADASSSASDSKTEATVGTPDDGPDVADVDDSGDLDDEASSTPEAEPSDEETSPTDENASVPPEDPESEADEHADAGPAADSEPKSSDRTDNSPPVTSSAPPRLPADDDRLVAMRSVVRDQSPAPDTGVTTPLARTATPETAALPRRTTAAVDTTTPTAVVNAPVAGQVGVVGVVSTLARWLGLGSFMSTAPAPPAAQPLLWGLLAWARREIQRTFFNRTPTTAYDLFDNEQIVDTNGVLTAVTGDLNAHDADGDPLTFTVVEAPGDGSVVINRDGTFVYTPSRELAAVGGTDYFVVKTADEGLHLHGPLAFFKQDFGRTTTTRVEVLVESACPNACQVNPVKVIGTIAVGDGPNGVAFSQDGSRAYVTNSLDNTVSVIDTATGTVAGTIAVGRHPQGVAFNPVANRAYVTNLLDGTVSVINTLNNSVITTVPVGASAVQVAVSPGGTRVYVIGSQTNGSTMSVINAATNTVISTATLNGAGYGLAVHPNGARVFVATQIDWLDVIDVLDNDVTHVDTDGGWLRGIGFNPLGTRVYIAQSDLNTVSVRNATTYAPIATIPVGSNPHGLAVNSSGTRVYVVNKDDGTLSVIRTSTNTVIKTVAVGSLPNSVAISPDGTYAYVTNGGSDTVSVIQLV